MSNIRWDSADRCTQAFWQGRKGCPFALPNPHNTEYTECQAFYPVVRIGSPPPPHPQGKSYNRCGRGGAGTQFRRGDRHSGTLCVLLYKPFSSHPHSPPSPFCCPKCKDDKKLVLPRGSILWLSIFAPATPPLHATLYLLPSD
jgi:hypothetical protein